MAGAVCSVYICMGTSEHSSIISWFLYQTLRHDVRAAVQAASAFRCMHMCTVSMSVQFGQMGPVCMSLVTL